MKEEKKDAWAQDAAQKKNIKSAKPSNAINSPPEQEESEEEVARYFGGPEPLTGHFIMTNDNSEEDDWKTKWALLSPSFLSFLKLLFSWTFWLIVRIQSHLSLGAARWFDLNGLYNC